MTNREAYIIRYYEDIYVVYLTQEQYDLLKWMKDKDFLPDGLQCDCIEDLDPAYP